MAAPVRPAILRAAPYFPVADVAAIGAYYERVLGFQREYAAGDPPEFAVYSRDGAPLMFRRVREPGLIRPNEQQGGAWDVFFWIIDADVLYRELTSAGAAVVYEPTVQPYGMKEFAVRDPNGYVLGFGQQISGA